MANYEQKIFEQVIENYFGETPNNVKVEEVNLNGVNFKLKDASTNGKEDNSCIKKTNESQKKKRESKSKAVLIEAEYHENLPEGWKKVVVQRTTGATAGKFDVYFFTPSGRKLRSKNEIKDYSDKHRLDLDLSNFGFSRPRREKPPAPSRKPKGRAGPPFPEKDSSVDMSDSSSTLIEGFSNGLGEEVGSSSSPTGDSASDCVVEGLSLSLEEDIKEALTQGLDTTAELDLPNTSFTQSSAPTPPADTLSRGEDLEFDLDRGQLGKTFKIERPLSFSCF